MRRMKAFDSAGFEIPDPNQLDRIIEFRIDSTSSDPSFSGPIEIRCEPKRLGVRWSGEQDWKWMEYHELTMFSDASSAHFKRIIEEQFEAAKQAGFDEGCKASVEPEQHREKFNLIYLPEKVAEG